jgi:hypothetical protein
VLPRRQALPVVRKTQGLPGFLHPREMGLAEAAHFSMLGRRRPWQRQIAEVDVQHVAREQSDRIAARRQGADRIAFGLGEVIEKLPHFADAHRAWMALAVESDEAYTPIGHGRRRRLGVPLMACGVMHLVKQAWRLDYGRRRLE